MAERKKKQNHRNSKVRGTFGYAPFLRIGFGRYTFKATSYTVLFE